MPRQYQLGAWDFYGLTITVRPGVFIPRPETEELVERILEHDLEGLGRDRPITFLELGTGTGCIAITLLAHRPRWRGVAVDVASEALVLARENAARHGVEARLTWVAQDIRGPMPEGWRGRYDLVVANPPYVRTQELASLPPEVQQEPRLALDGGQDGLEVTRHVVRWATRVLKSGGWLVCEIGYDQADAMRVLLTEHRFQEITIHPDLAGIPRIATARHG